MEENLILVSSESSHLSSTNSDLLDRNDFLNILGVEVNSKLSEQAQCSVNYNEVLDVVHVLSDSDEPDESETQIICNSSTSSPQKSKMRVSTKRKKGRKMSQEENDKKEEEALKKRKKKAIAETLRQMKPGECLKFVTVELDSSLLDFEYGDQLATLQNLESKLNVGTHVVPYTITWTRNAEFGTIPSMNNDLIPVLVIWQWKELINCVKFANLSEEVGKISQLLPANRVTLVVYGLGRYFRSLKMTKKRQMHAEVVMGCLQDKSTLRSKQESAYVDAPLQVTSDEVEMALAELQLVTGACHRLIETPDDLSLLVTQFTKAVAQTPFKREKHQREQEKLDWFAAGDSKDCVRVDHSSNGLLRLWQQQICQFNCVTLDTARAVTCLFSSPQALLKAYAECKSKREAELLLQDIPIKKSVGPMSSVRRLGPELSKKIHLFFHDSDGEAMEAEVSHKVLRYEEFLNDVLKEHLKKTHAHLDRLNSEIAEYVQLKNIIQTIQVENLVAEGVKTKVDIGCNFYMQADIPDPSRIYIDVGLGYFIEFNLDESIKVIEKRVSLLNKQTGILKKDSVNTKAHIKLVLLGIQELQNIK